MGGAGPGLPLQRPLVGVPGVVESAAVAVQRCEAHERLDGRPVQFRGLLQGGDRGLGVAELLVAGAQVENVTGLVRRQATGGLEPFERPSGVAAPVERHAEQVGRGRVVGRRVHEPPSQRDRVSDASATQHLPHPPGLGLDLGRGQPRGRRGLLSRLACRHEIEGDAHPLSLARERHRPVIEIRREQQHQSGGRCEQARRLLALEGEVVRGPAELDPARMVQAPPGRLGHRGVIDTAQPARRVQVGCLVPFPVEDRRPQGQRPLRRHGPEERMFRVRGQGRQVVVDRRPDHALERRDRRAPPAVRRSGCRPGWSWRGVPTSASRGG